MQKMQQEDMEQALYQEPTADNIQDFIRVLEDHRRTCEVEQKYVEAEMAKNRIAELKHQDYNRRYEELIFNQTQQREECEQAHIKQYQEFNQQWDEDLLHTQKEDAQALGELEDRHT